MNSHNVIKHRSSHRRCSIKKHVLKIHKTHRKTPVPEPPFLTKLQAASGFINKETLLQVFSCEFCKIFNNTFFKDNTGQLLLKATFLVLNFTVSKKTQYQNNQSLPKTSVNSIRYFNRGTLDVILTYSRHS